MEKKLASLEALLFAWGDPLELGEIEKVLKLDPGEVRELAQALKDRLEAKDRGLRLVQVEDKLRLSTKPEYYELIKDYARDRQMRSLSSAAMETLSIIAYKQPIIRAEIEDIRGVKCDRVLRSLLDVGLIEISGTLDRPGRPKIYQTTPFFLLKFGLKSLEDLPRQGLSDLEEINFLEEA
ncbi:MAG: SMC-Scp complex subunit ScpB [Tissierellia bacterium]|nr:SMC-Scp complex subunit ScpB [Tissierellia bacterium]